MYIVQSQTEHCVDSLFCEEFDKMKKKVEQVHYLSLYSKPYIHIYVRVCNFDPLLLHIVNDVCKSSPETKLPVSFSQSTFTMKMTKLYDKIIINQQNELLK
jgi:hypothetical protein